LVDRYRLDALSILTRLEEGKALFLDREYNRSFGRYSPHERDTLVSLVRGVVKFRKKLDGVARAYLPKWEKLPPFVRNTLRLGIFQLLFHTHVPSFAVVHEWVEAIKPFQGTAFVSLVNAVLRNVERNLKEHRDDASLWGVDLPPWLEREWQEMIGEEDLQDLRRSLALPPPLFVRVNTLKTRVRDLEDFLTQRGIESEKTVLPGALRVFSSYSDLLGLREHAQWLFYPQDLGSQVVGHLFGPSPGEKVVDACCGVGGKSFLMAQLMENRGLVRAWDKSKRRIGALLRIAQKSGISIIRPEVLDCLTIPPVYFETADRLLLDAPCSNLGTIRRNPEVLWKVSKEEAQRVARKQLELLLSVFQVVKKGGVMVYSVCTLTREETISVVEAFEKAKGRAVVRITLSLEDFGVHSEKEGWVFLWPHRLECDGFFVAAWRKKG